MQDLHLLYCISQLQVSCHSTRDQWQAEVCWPTMKKTAKDCFSNASVQLGIEQGSNLPIHPAMNGFTLTINVRIKIIQLCGDDVNGDYRLSDSSTQSG